MIYTISKKILIVLIIFCVINVTKAQTSSLQAQTSDSGAQVISQQSGPNPESMAIISKAGVLFCNDGFEKEKMKKSLKLDIRPGESKDLCVIFYNQNTFPIKIIPSVSIGVPGGSTGEYLCDQDDSPTNSRYEILQAPRKSTEIEVTAEKGQVLLRTGTIVAPKNFSGTLPVCFSITLSEKEKIAGMFKLKHRRGYQIILNSTGDVYNPGLLTTIKQNQSTILKVLAGIIGIRLVISIFQQVSKTNKKKKPSHHKK